MYIYPFLACSFISTRYIVFREK
ncbi:unnamed protein product [Spirodela intermedia]|uniref:Uncharacterized protein n=1 Tax=Spirodela intermedia TaxID=51605 RepID=A0A7I8LGR3_SPIIN|nr:unnamed protein product [Spirodela intermedia]